MIIPIATYLLACFAFASGLAPSEPRKSIDASNDLPNATFDTRSDPLFADATVPLRAFLRQPYNRRHRGPQHFCIVGYAGSGTSRSAIILWREGRRLIHWSGANDPAWREDSIAFSTRQIDLTRDVVPRMEDIGGSTYLVTRAWVDRVQRDCRAAGARYSIRR
jgi:hypothetical protein